MKISFYSYSPQRTNFYGRKEVMEKADAFSDDLCKNVKKGRTSFSDTKKLIQKYDSGILLSRNKPAMNKWEICDGAFIPHFRFLEETQKLQISGKNIFLSPFRHNYSEKGDYVRAIAHEMTHAFQIEDNEYSEIRLFNKYLSNKTLKEAEKIVNKTYCFWLNFERPILYNIIDCYNRTCFLNQDNFPYNISINNKLMKAFLSTKLNKLQKLIPKSDMALAKEFIKLKLRQEADAYEIGKKAERKFNRESYTPQDNIIPQIYRQIARCIE